MYIGWYMTHKSLLCITIYCIPNTEFTLAISFHAPVHNMPYASLLYYMYYYYVLHLHFIIYYTSPT